MTQKSESIEKCLDWIRTEQESDGSFKSFSISRKSKKYFEYRTTFFTSLILSSLSGIPEAIDICKKAVNFLLSQKSPKGSFNYWAASTSERNVNPYPDDLDDTFCALAALYSFDPKLVSGEEIAKAIKILICQEVSHGGPYRTWLSSIPGWSDVDIAVNSNVGFFLAQLKTSLPNLNNFVENKILEKDFQSIYYPTIYPVIYFISRWYKGGLKEILATQIWLMKGRNHWGNILNHSLALNSLWDLGFREEVKIEIDILEQKVFEVVKRYPFCLDPIKNDQRHFGTCPALNAAFCAEIIYKSTVSNSVDNRIDQLFVKVCEKTIEILNKNPRTKILAEATLLEIRKNWDDVYTSVLPLLLHEKFSASDYAKALLLGVYNCLGCIAFRFYDDKQDNGIQDMERETLSQVCEQNMKIIMESCDNQNFKKFANTIFTKMHEANAWEKINLTKEIYSDGMALNFIPEFGDKWMIANKSLGYVIASAGVFFFVNQAKRKNLITLTKFFQHYITARQLNDDAHDWEEDLNKGIISYPNSKILKKFLAERTSVRIVVNKHLGEFRRIFWNNILPEVANDILFHIEQAASMLKEMDFVKNKEIFLIMLDNSKKAAETALEEHRRTVELIEEYSNI